MLKGSALKGRIFKPKDITKHLFFIDFFLETISHSQSQLNKYLGV